MAVNLGAHRVQVDGSSFEELVSLRPESLGPSDVFLGKGLWADQWWGRVLGKQSCSMYNGKWRWTGGGAGVSSQGVVQRGRELYLGGRRVSTLIPKFLTKFWNMFINSFLRKQTPLNPSEDLILPPPLHLFFERKRAQVGEGQREGETKIPSRLHAISTEPDAGLELTN